MIVPKVEELADLVTPQEASQLLQQGAIRLDWAGHEAAREQVNSSPARVFVTHTRPEPLLGTLKRLNTGRNRTATLRFTVQGGILTVDRILFVNHCTWAHVLAETVRIRGLSREDLLTSV